MLVESWPIDRVKPYERNPRINDGAVDAVAKSLAEFGFRQPLVVDTDGVLIVGHTRWKAAKRLGMTEVPVHVARDLEPEAVRAYRIPRHLHRRVVHRGLPQSGEPRGLPRPMRLRVGRRPVDSDHQYLWSLNGG